MQHVDHLGHWRGLVDFVNVSDDRHAERCFHVFEDAQAFFQAWATVGVDRGAVGFVEAGFEDVGDAQFLSDAHVRFTGPQGKVFGLEDVDAAEQHEGRGVGALDGWGDLDHGLLCKSHKVRG